MNSKVGLICGGITGKIYAIVNPDEDTELDNPRWLLIKVIRDEREPLLLLRVSLDEYMTCTHHDQVQEIANRSFRL